MPLKQDVRIATKPQPCISPTLCQGLADLAECAEEDDELDCPGELADECAESSGMSDVLVQIVLILIINRRGRRRRPSTLPLLDPIFIPHPLFLSLLLQTAPDISCRPLSSRPEPIFSNRSQGPFFAEREICFPKGFLRLGRR